MSCAVAWSGGKDSMLALDRAIRQGRHVRFLFNIVDARSGRVRFHGVRADMIARQAAALGLDLVQVATHPDGFEDTFLSGLDELRRRGADTIVFGNIHLEDVRGWYEERTTAHGFLHEEPLWGGDPAALVMELLDRGYRTRVTSVDLQHARRSWLGRELDRELALEIGATPHVDPAGESGEYHTYVFDGPLFSAPIAHVTGDTREEAGHALIDLH